MKPSREESLFQRALEMPVEKRTSFLASVGSSDPALRERLEALLAANEQPATELAVDGEATLAADAATGFIDEAVGQTIGRYKLLEKLGEGGFGAVWAAEQKEPVRRRVALKIIKLGMDTKQVVARFEAERQALALMDHPNIAKVLDAGTTETGRPYFVMELVKGVPITKYCDQEKLDTEARLDLFIKVCHAIQHAHQKGIIHRDIKPTNIMVTLHDGVPVPKVIDFGIAKATQQELTEKTIYTHYSQFIGTPAYMSPEQAEMSGLDIDTRSDIYSLGVLLYELLTGTTPFDTKELMQSGLDEMRRIIREREPVPPGTRLSRTPSEDAGGSTSAARRPALPSDLDWIVMKCLEKDRQRRYETANGLAADLKRHLANEPVVARPPTTAYRLRKAFRRNKMGFLSAAGVAAATLVGIAAVVIVQSRANTKLKGTNIELTEARQAIGEQLSASRKSQAELVFRKGRELAERGDITEGIFWMIESLKVAPEEMADFQHTVRLNLSSWSQALPRFERWWPGDSVAKSFAFSPDGDSVLLGFKDGTLRHLHLVSGEELHPPRVFTNRMVAGLGFHPNGRVFAIGLAGDGDRSTKDGSEAMDFDTPSDALLWDLQTWSRTGQPMPHGGGVYDVRFIRDGTRLLTREYPGTTLRLWDPASSKLVRKPWVVDQHQIAEGLEYAPDGTRILLRMQQDGQSRILTADDFEPVGAALAQNGRLHQFHPDGSGVIAARPGPAAGTILTLVDPLSGEPLGFEFDLPTRAPSSRFGPDGRELWVVCHDETVHGLDLFTGRSLGPPIPEGELSWATPDPGSRFMLTSRAQWRLPRRASRLPAPIDRVRPGGPEIRFGRASRTAVSHAAGGTLVLTRPDGPRPRRTAARLWDARSGQPVGMPLHTAGNAISDVALSADGSLAATCAMADPGLWEFNVGFVELWDARTGRRLLGPLSPSSPVAVLEFSPDGSLLAGGGYDGTVRFWDTRTGLETGEPLTDPEIIFSLRFSPDGTRIAAGTTWARTGSPHARVWDVATRQPLFDPFAGFDREWVMFLEFTPDGRRLLVGSESRTTVWDVTTGKPVFVQPRAAAKVFAQRLNPDGRLIATGNQNGVIRLLSVETGAPMGRPMQHTRPIQCLAFSPDGQMLVTGSTEGTVRLWDLRTYEPAGMPFAHTLPVFAVTFAADGRSVISTDADGRCRVWPVSEPARGSAAELSSLVESWTLSRLDQGVVRELSETELDRVVRPIPEGASSEVRLGSPLAEEAWHRARALDAEDDRDWFGALWHLDRLLVTGQSDWMLLARHGRAQVGRGDLEAAAADFAASARLASRVGDSGGLQGLLRQFAFDARNDRQWSAAVWFLGQALAGSPGDWQCFADRAEAHAELGNDGLSQADFARALELSSERSSIPDVAGQFAAAGKWAELAEEYTRMEKAGWLFLEDWRRYALALLIADNPDGYRQLVERFRSQVGRSPLRNVLPELEDGAGWKDVEENLRSLQEVGATP